MIDALFDLLATTAAAVPPAAPAADPPTAPPMDTKPVVQVVFIVMGLTIATIVLVAGLLAMAMLRHASRGASPTRTEHVDAWAEAGKRAQAEPSAGDILDDLDD